MVRVYALRLEDDWCTAHRQALLAAIPQHERTRIASYVNQADADRSLLGNHLARYVAAQWLGIPNQDIRFALSATGKPFVDGKKDFHFNVSHSGHWVVCAANSASVGIDIECISAIDIGLFQTYIDEHAYASLQLMNKADQLAHFYRYWTMKEAYVKQTGLGVTVPLEDISIITGADGEKSIALLGCPIHSLFIKQYAIAANYALSVCADTNVFSALAFVLPHEILF